MTSTNTAVVPDADEVLTGLDDVRRRLRGHGGDLRVSVVSDDGAVELEFVGACRGCPALAFTFTAVVAPAATALSGVTDVTSGQTQRLPFVARRIAAISEHRQGEK